jgi:flagellar protein FliS
MHTPHDAYLTSHVMTASPARLRLLLIDGALRQARQAGTAWKSQQFEAAGQAVDRCRDILTELMTSPNADLAPELARQVSGLYAFMFRTLNEASLAHDAQKLADVIRLLEIERETWQIVAAQTAEAAAPSTDAPSRQPSASHSPIGRGQAAQSPIAGPHRPAANATSHARTTDSYPPSAFSVEA